SFVSSAHAASKIVEAHGAGYAITGDPRPAVTEYIHSHTITEGTYPSLAALTKQISDSVEQYGSVAKTPLDKVPNLRNDMYLSSEGFRVLAKDKESELSAADKTQIASFKKELDGATKFIPIWVKICVAIALGLGTMVANGSGMQWSTVRSIALAWVLTLPAAMIMSGLLYVIFRQIFGRLSRPTTP